MSAEPPTPLDAALFVVRLLRRSGQEALLAGGCVRDMLLDLPSSDYDVATSATPGEVAEIFHRVLLVGAKFGVAVVLYKGQQIEVATFRSDVSYSDGRRPDAVTFSDPRQDALRRDFTINGMFYDPIDEQVIDYVGGRADLAAGVVRTIGQPRRRFAEDYLRMLRAPRFAVRFAFRLDPATAEAIGEQAGKITSISGERIRDELTKMLRRDSAAEAMALLAELGLAQKILPDLFADPELWQRGLDRLTRTAETCDATVNFAAMLCELPLRTIRRITRNWGMSNRQLEAIRFAATHLDALPAAAGQMRLADLKRLLADGRFDMLRTIWQAKERAETGTTALSERLGKRIASINPDAVDPPVLLDGAELIKMGLAEGPRLGQVLQAVRDAQLQEKIHTKEQARALAAELIDTPPEAR